MRSRSPLMNRSVKILYRWHDFYDPLLLSVLFYLKRKYDFQLSTVVT